MPANPLSPEQIDRVVQALRSRYRGWESFDHPDFIEDETRYKREASAQAADLLSAPALHRLVAEGHFDEILRRLQHIGRATNLLYQRVPKSGDLGILYQPNLDETRFCAALVDLLHGEGESPDRLGRYLAWVESAGLPNRWTFPTYFLFMCHPETEIFIKPGVTARFLDLLGFQEQLKGPSSTGYATIRSLAHEFRDALADRGAKDMVDIQSAIFIAGQKDGTGHPAPAPPDPDARLPFEKLRAILRSKGLYFPAEVVSNYLLALQTKRFVIITGISGTGKTQLALEVARYFRPVAGNYVVEAVRPDWTDHRGLLGYFNPLTGRYVSTPFLDLVLRAREEEVKSREEGRAPHPFFAILDEMNLARVEHYFSDVLSALESGEALRLHDEEGVPIPRSLRVPRNLFFTGTVNIDESTYMFSPKVLDRAFTLELNDVHLDGLSSLGSPEDGGPGLHLDRFPGRLLFEGSPNSKHWELLGEEPKGIVKDLNSLLAHENRHFGYRVATEISRFVTLAAEQAENEEAQHAALDLALLQKVLPKLHGTQQELEDLLKRLSQFGSEAGLPRFTTKVQRMLRRLERQGFTSFIE